MKRHVLVGGETLDHARDYVGRGSFMDMAAESPATITRSSTAAATARAFAGLDPAVGKNCCPGGRL